MSISLALLTARLQSMVPPRNGSPADYEQVVRDAVAQLGSDVPIITSAKIAIVAGQADYDLPADFLFLIELESLILALTAWRIEHAFAEGNTLRFAPTPEYSVERTLRYAAGYALEDGAYPRLTENGARIALLYAAHLALMAQAADAAAGAWKYQIGDEMVDRSQHGRAVSEQAGGALKQYQAAVAQLRGYGQRARLSGAGGAAWA